MKFRAKPIVRKKAASGQTQTPRLVTDTSGDSPLRCPQCVNRSDTRGGGGGRPRRAPRLQNPRCLHFGGRQLLAAFGLNTNLRER